MSALFRFVELIEELARTGMLDQLAIQPVLFAAATTPYAAALVTRMAAAAEDAVILKTFLGPTQLAEVRPSTISIECKPNVFILKQISAVMRLFAKLAALTALRLAQQSFLVFKAGCGSQSLQPQEACSTR